MFAKSSTWYRLFSPTLEDCVKYASKEGIFPKSLSAKLTQEEIEAFSMWTNKQHGIMPNQYHYSYENGDTIIYPEHIRDLIVIDTMVFNKHENDRKKQEAEAERKRSKSSLGSMQQQQQQQQQQQKGAGFYGHTFKFNNNN